MGLEARKPSADQTGGLADGHHTAAAFDRRAHVRHAISAPGVIFFESGDRSVDCTILNVSSAGARVALAEPAGLPDAVGVLGRPGAYLRALVRWRIGLEIGLEFVG
jgi:hypothetical protein